MDLVPLSALIEADRTSTPEYKTGYDRIFKKKKAKPSDYSAGYDRIFKKKKAKPPKPPKKESRSATVEKQRSRQKAARKHVAKAHKSDKEQAQQAKADRMAKAEKERQEKTVSKPVGVASIPAQISHCMMALHVKRGKSKQAAWNICRWAMTKYGYLQGPYRRNTKLPKATVTTGKGSRRNMQHAMEKNPLNGGVRGTGDAKFKRFVRMFKSLEPDIVKSGR